MEIPIEAARTLAAIVDAGTFDAAARALRVTPSAISQRVKSLEQQFGRVLLVRSKPVRATEAGAAMIRLVRQLALLEHDALTSIGVEADAARPASLPLAVNADSLATWFLPALAAVGETRDVVFELHRQDQDHTAALLESGTVMAVVTSEAVPVGGCVVVPLGRMRYRAVAAPGFAARRLPDGGTPAELALAPAVDFDRFDELQRRYLRERGVDPESPPRHFVPASGDFAAAIRLGLGWGMLPEAQCDDALAEGRLVGLPGPFLDVPLHWQQWNLRSTLLDAVAAAVAAAARVALR